MKNEGADTTVARGATTARARPAATPDAPGRLWRPMPTCRPLEGPEASHPSLGVGWTPRLRHTHPRAVPRRDNVGRTERVRGEPYVRVLDGRTVGGAVYRLSRAKANAAWAPAIIPGVSTV